MKSHNIVKQIKQMDEQIEELKGSQSSNGESSVVDRYQKRKYGGSGSQSDVGIYSSDDL